LSSIETYDEREQDLSMNEDKDLKETATRDDETLARLLRLAGPREAIPDDVEERVYASVLEEWKNSTSLPEPTRIYGKVHREWRRRNRLQTIRRWTLPVALAASVVLAITALLQPVEPVAVAPTVGTVARSVDAGNDGGLPNVGDRLYAGDVLQTGTGDGVSVALVDAVSLRIDENSRLEVIDSGHYRLASGRIYVDSGNFLYRENHLQIDTQWGAVTDVGTQFVVAAVAGQLEVAVREGRVDITQDGTARMAVAGERLRIDASGDAVVDAIESHTDFWSWATELAPPFDIENKSLLDFLRWAARETGRELVFEDQDLRMSAMRTDLHGSVAGFQPMEAIESVLATTSFRYRIESDRIIIVR
jgi:ferric-dicitrate binding protein FerR (iron transport regulator)